MSFRSVFLAVVIAFALIVGAFLINRARPSVETQQPSAELVRATGKCAECHARTQYSVVHEYEMSKHAQKGVNCLDCHQPATGQDKKDHHAGASTIACGAIARGTTSRKGSAARAISSLLRGCWSRRGCRSRGPTSRC